MDPLPLVHSNVPYSLAFYHVNSAMQMYASSMHNAPLETISCRGTTGSRPTIHWAASPRLAPSPSGPPTFLLQYTLVFAIDATLDGTAEDFKSSGYKKNWFISSGFRNFNLCTHMRRVFKSHWVSANRQQGRRAGVSFSLKNILGQEFEAEWRSEIGLQPVNMCCAMCCTDSSMTFSLDG